MEIIKRRNKVRWLVFMTRRIQVYRQQMKVNAVCRKYAAQKLMGVGMLIISAMILGMCGASGEDCGAVLITAPLGLILLFSREIWIV